MRVLTVVGARPQFIKAAVVSRELRKNHTEILVHTGQHFDYNMSGQFFEELHIPDADYNLGISGGSHAQMTGKMLIALERVLLKEMPDWVLLYGDTNSTLAASLAAAKLHIPICHVEAGIRAHQMANPEEVNRICTDHVATLLLAPTDSSMEELEHEGLSNKAFIVGDPMYDAFRIYRKIRKPTEIRLQMLDGRAEGIPKSYYYLTCHREENTREDNNLLEIFKAMEQLDAPVVYPVHPRNKERAVQLARKYGFCNIMLVQPVGYLESISLVNYAKKVITDSGGLQREAFFAGKKCVTVLDFVVWPETMAEGRNVLSKPNAGEILQKLSEPQRVDNQYQPFGDGHSAEKIIRKLEEIG